MLKSNKKHLNRSDHSETDLCYFHKICIVIFGISLYILIIIYHTRKMTLLLLKIHIKFLYS